MSHEQQNRLHLMSQMGKITCFMSSERPWNQKKNYHKALGLTPLLRPIAFVWKHFLVFLPLRKWSTASTAPLLSPCTPCLPQPPSSVGPPAARRRPQDGWKGEMKTKKIHNTRREQRACTVGKVKPGSGLRGTEGSVGVRLANPGRSFGKALASYLRGVGWDARTFDTCREVTWVSVWVARLSRKRVGGREDPRAALTAA